MAKELNKVEYYYDSHPTEEDLMGETSWHDSLITYLKLVLSWLFHDQTCAIYSDLNFYQTRNPGEYPVAPDIAVFKGIAFQHTTSWTLTNGEPVPQVVFEILSKETWKKDEREKPSTYANIGVHEYFTYDPHEPPLLHRKGPRLRGWRLDPQQRKMVEIEANRQGWLWSEQLESWLVPDGAYLRLYDRNHQMRLTEAEARAQQAEIAVERADAADERARVEAERATIEARRAEAALRKAQTLAEKLRSLGINPDEI